MEYKASHVIIILIILVLIVRLIQAIGHAHLLKTLKMSLLHLSIITTSNHLCSILCSTPPSIYLYVASSAFPRAPTDVHQQDGSTFVPSYVIPGTMARQTPTGHPFITPAFIPGLLPTSTLSGTLPLPFVTPAFSALPLPTPQIPQQPFAPRVIELSSPLAWPVSGDSSALVWDIWRLPSSAFRRNHRGNFFKLSDGELGAPATTPASDTITIICRVGVVGEFWPTITVRGSPVTIENVLDAIYNHFHAEVTEAEYDEMLGMNRENCSSMLRAMYERCQWSYSLFEDVWRVGIRRLDCLGDMHIFKGLKVEYSSNDSWFLDFQLTTP